jgi:outer membrane receptor protein involved in Fe transport
MLRNLLLTIGIVLATSLSVFSQSGALQGKVLDKDTREPIPFANVAVFSGDDLVTGATTDFDGKYVIKPLTPGKFNVRASFVGYQTKEIAGVVVTADAIAFQDIELGSTTETLETVEIVEYKVPLIQKDKTVSGATVTSEEIAQMPNRNATAIATTVGGVYSDADGGNVSIRGQRSNGTAYYIDGIRVTGSSSLPESAIEQVAVILGGTPARYGDATGGIISVTTKGPSSEFGAGVELQTSQFLDKFGYNRVGFNFQGPLFSKVEDNKKTSILGYFVAGDVIYRQDGSPSAKGTIDKVQDSYLDYLKENPQVPTGTGFGLYNTSQYTLTENTEPLSATQNTHNTNVNLSGKIDLRTSPTINLTFGGQFNYQDYNAFTYAYSLFNYENNPHVNSRTWRVFGKFTQRFPVDKESTSLIKNVFYTIQADFSKFYQTVENENHGDNLFNYGYLGKFETTKQRSYELGTDTVNGTVYNNVYLHNAYQDTGFYFNAYDVNPVVARYTEQYYEFYPDKGNWRFPATGHWLNYNQVQLYGGLLNGQSPEGVYSMWTNVGTQYDGYSVTDNTQIGIDANVSLDIGNHAIEFGLQYQQRSDRGYGYEPVNFWGLTRLITNAQIAELDKSNPQLVMVDGVFQDTINYTRLYSPVEQRVFDMNLRERMGLPVNGTDWIDIDSYDVNKQTINYFDANNNLIKDVPVEGGLSVDMFSADELLNDGNNYVYYYGYDPFGNKQTSRPAFADFFNNTVTNDIGGEQYTRDIGAFEPIYGAFFIQDKFAFDDLIFNIGVRVDRFDANQMVLKDPYLFYSAYDVDEVSSIGGQPVSHPDNINGGATVYIDNKDNPTEITGYREGSVWYNSQGTVIQNPDVLDAGNGITPYLVNPDQQNINADVFTDYEPQVNVMPRVSFSFPISEEALFFAHYDILTQRPTSLLRMDPVQYYYIAKQGSINNPNLKPSKSIDYELGFQQKISNSSSLKISAFYKEMRDQVQYYRYTGAYTGGSNLYYSYNNIDFGTAKGLTVEYDLRRTNNVRARISYTLQFAEGTGSSPTTAAALVNAGLPNLRTVFPLNWDRRHAFNVVLDYRFGEGKNYNGPTSTRQVKGTDQVKTTQWLKNFGINLTLRGGSGTPYTRSDNVVGTYAGGGSYQLEGSINGSRLPWQFGIDARVDKSFDISKKPNSTTYFNVYFQFLNLLNTLNITGVYPATGSPDDDGYLTSPEWQDYINNQLDPTAYRDLYTLRMNTPYNYSTPRQIRLGIIFNF